MLKDIEKNGLLNICRSGISDLFKHFMRRASVGIAGGEKNTTTGVGH